MWHARYEDTHNHIHICTCAHNITVWMHVLKAINNKGDGTSITVGPLNLCHQKTHFFSKWRKIRKSFLWYMIRKRAQQHKCVSFRYGWQDQYLLWTHGYIGHHRSYQSSGLLLQSHPERNRSALVYMLPSNVAFHSKGSRASSTAAKAMATFCLR